MQEKSSIAIRNSAAAVPRAVPLAAGLLLAAAAMPALSQSLLDNCEIGGMNTDLASEEMTRSERIALMEKQYFDSLAAFSECMERRTAAADQNDSGSSGAAGYVDSTAAQGIEGTEPDTSAYESTAAPEPRELAAIDPQSPTDSPVNLDRADAAQSESRPSRPISQDLVANNGAVPEDLRNADNDSVLEAQIRRAASSETDPVAREKLWNQLRKYKQRRQ